ncbi:MFS transporter [Xanthobacter tagetidis]|uniref:MFS transporter n=1 Tax=Xanthobacter tagetidis TaxID=60216 RepID=A0A3L7A4Y9_9HYPH|nr:MFS transporter [Xanthobacter tagetidis]MBB6310011.1 ACS family tartrate transporter-like MFS transporter [Xanthobacter tagetidis]RLP75115.1 MFS transporter [Xanthobacter tagetidis]
MDAGTGLTVEERRTFSKVARRLIPFMMLLYLVSFLDRVNVGFAALTMNADLGFSPEVFGWGAGIFFIGYFLFEVPSNLALEKVGARLWICRIMLTWGLISAGTAFVTGPTSFFVMRFLLGAAEAGFLPGMILYLGYWFPLALRARYIALFMAAVPIASAVGAPLSAFIMESHGLLGLAGWQWLFIVEGLPAVLLAFAVLVLLPNGPGEVRWLTAQEKRTIAVRLAADHAGHDGAAHHALWPALRDRRVLMLCLIYFGLVVGLYGIGLWLPQIVREMGYSVRQVGYVLIVPYALSALAMLAWGRHSDATGERVLHVAAAGFLGAAGLVASVHAPTHLLAIAAVTCASVGLYAALAPFWSVPPLFLRGTAAAAGIALINSVGNLGGFVGPYAVGFIKQHTDRFTAGFELLAAVVCAAALLTLMLRAMLRRRGSLTGPRDHRPGTCPADAAKRADP